MRHEALKLKIQLAVSVEEPITGPIPSSPSRLSEFRDPFGGHLGAGLSDVLNVSRREEPKLAL